MSKIHNEKPARRGHTGPSRPPHRRRAIGELLARGPKKRRIAIWAAIVVLGVAAIAMAVFVFTDFKLADVGKIVDWSRVTAAIERLDAGLVIPLMAILPVFGFPVSVVYLVAGARFGPVWGGVVVALATAVHLLASYGIARTVFRKPLQRFIDKRHKKLPEIPEDEQALVALVVALVPGIPYIVRIYLVALADMRLRIYFWVSLVVYTLRSYVTILLGDLSSDPSGRRLVILLAVDAVKIVICGLAIWWLRVHHRRYHGEHHDDHHDAPAPATGAG
jgi:uncharacterized membrane protein YdjX (TVP38/TMEM64 family)